MGKLGNFFYIVFRFIKKKERKTHNKSPPFFSCFILNQKKTLFSQSLKVRQKTLLQFHFLYLIYFTT